MKIRFLSALLLLLLVISGCKKDNPIPDELLKDGGFENLQGGIWYVFNDTTGFNLRLASPGYNTSGHAAAAGRTALHENSSGFSQQYAGEIPVGEKLELSCWIKAENLTGNGVSIAISCKNGENPNLQFVTTEGQTAINGTFDWQQFTVTLPKVYVEVKSISIFLIYLPGTTGKVYFDDVSLKHK